VWRSGKYTPNTDVIWHWSKAGWGLCEGDPGILGVTHDTLIPICQGDPHKMFIRCIETKSQKALFLEFFGYKDGLSVTQSPENPGSRTILI